MSAVTPQQRAIEFGEYLAKGAEHLLDALNAGFLAREAVEEHEGEDDAALKALTDAVDEALQYEAEMMRGLRSKVYEFRKRAERANAALAQPAPTEPQSAGAPPKLESAKRATGWVAPKDRYVPPVLFNPYNGEPRDVRDVQTDPQGILIVPPGALMLAAVPPPSAEEPKL